jgi:hypothetical protein
MVDANCKVSGAFSKHISALQLALMLNVLSKGYVTTWPLDDMKDDKIACGEVGRLNRLSKYILLAVSSASARIPVARIVRRCKSIEDCHLTKSHGTFVGLQLRLEIV